MAYLSISSTVACDDAISIKGVKSSFLIKIDAPSSKLTKV